jgi:hypothetical protein
MTSESARQTNTRPVIPDGPASGVYVHRRDSASLANVIAGGRVFPGAHGHARFDVTETASSLRVRYATTDGSTWADVAGAIVPELPASRLFADVAEASEFFRRGSDDARLAEPTAHALGLWTDQIESVLVRILTGSPVAEVADIPGLARAISAAFVGLELYEGVDESGAAQAMAALDQLAVLVEVVDDLGPVARRALRAKVAKKARSAKTRKGPVAEPA